MKINRILPMLRRTLPKNGVHGRCFHMSNHVCALFSCLINNLLDFFVNPARSKMDLASSYV